MILDLGDVLAHRFTTRDRIEVTLAPAVLLEMAPATRLSQSGGYWTAAA